MKPTKILLKEIEYGKNLFADNEPVLKEPYEIPTWFKDSILSLTGGEDKLERNTEDENLLLTALRKFTGPEGIYASDRGEVGAPQELIDSANTLLSLKSKFPKILDPTISNTQPRSINSVPMAFRGATIPYSTFDKLDWDKYEDLSDLIYVKNDPGIEVSPRSGKGLHSFTTALNIAINFSIRAKDDMSTRVPIIIAIPLDDPHLLFSPTFTDLVNDFGEKEVLFVGNTFKPAYFLLEDDVAYRLMVGPYKYLEQQDTSMLDDN
jgi:hypothetical protein